MSARRGKKVIALHISKRQKFVFGVMILSLGLFFAGRVPALGTNTLIIALLLALFTDLFLLWGIFQDVKGNFTWSIFILPFFYSNAFGLFYFLFDNPLHRLILCVIYAIGLYSVFLVQNIFTVSSIRTIALLQGARIVSIIITFLSFLFLSNVVFSLHANLVPMLILHAFFTYPLAYQSVWTYVLQKNEVRTLLWWVGGITLCIIEAAALLWFWPGSPFISAIFLTGFFYTLVGLSHVWFERRLFRGVLWEYLWVGMAVFFILVAFTPWGK